MTPSSARLVARLGLRVALVVAAAIAASSGSTTPSTTFALASSRSTASAFGLSAGRMPRRPQSEPGPYSYRWPIKPFSQQHPVRGFFGDPRISNHGESHQFHFGIDISAPNGTPVYATITGSVYIHPLHATTIAIVAADGTEFSYWHVVPVVGGGQRAIAYKTVIGHIEEPYGHVHFSEMRDGRYLNPLRPGAMGPFVDDTKPTVRSVVARDGMLVAETYDETPLAVPRPWFDLPVMPALVRWRLLDSSGRVAIGWSTAADFRLTIPPASEFDDRWAPGTTQNHVRAPGRYKVVLTHSLDVRAGRYQVEVAVRDTRGNGSVQRFPLDLSGS
jgi:Peptidase family M23